MIPTERETLPRVILVDLDPHVRLASEVEECLSSSCRLIRAETVFPSVEPSTGVSGAADVLGWTDQGFAAAVVCSSNTDLATEGRISLEVQLLELPVLLVTDAANPVVMSRLLRAGVADFTTTPLRKRDIVPRLEHLLESSPKTNPTESAPRVESNLAPPASDESGAFREAPDHASSPAPCDLGVEREFLDLIHRIVAHSGLASESRSGEPVPLFRAVLHEMAFNLTVVPVAKNPLTARETEVAKLVGKGRGNCGIAVELGISESTVRRHLQNVFGKLKVSSRAALVRRIAVLLLALDPEDVGAGTARPGLS